MAIITVKDRKEMRKEQNALHIDVIDGQLYIWGTVNQTICVYPEVFTMADPEGKLQLGTFTLPKSPPSPPGEDGIAEIDRQLIPNAKTGMTLVKLLMPFAGEGGLNEGTVDVLERLIREVKSHRQDPPKTPPEMPEDTAPIHVTKFNNDGDSTRAPFLGGVCAKFSKAVGKKPANSCTGCTVTGCKAKGKVE